MALAALCYGAWITVETLLFGNPLEGWPTLAAGIMLFSGVQLMSIGVLGEYIGRIYDEVKRRPLYVVDQHVATHALPVHLFRMLGESEVSSQRVSAEGDAGAAVPRYTFSAL